MLAEVPPDHTAPPAGPPAGAAVGFLPVWLISMLLRPSAHLACQVKQQPELIRGAWRPPSPVLFPAFCCGAAGTQESVSPGISGAGSSPAGILPHKDCLFCFTWTIFISPPLIFFPSLVFVFFLARFPRFNILDRRRV